MVRIPLQTFSQLMSQFPIWPKPGWKDQDVLWTAPSWARERSCIFPFSSLDWVLCSVVNVSAHGGHSRNDPGLVTARGCSEINQSAFQTAASGLPVGEAACTTIWNLDTSHLLGQWIRVGAWAEKKGTGHSKQTLNLGWYLHCCCNLAGRSDRVRKCGSNSRCVNTMHHWGILAYDSKWV